MADHCQFPHCVVPSEEGCGAGEPDHRKCHHWKIGQLRSECQKYREILLAFVDVGDVRAEAPGMLSVLYRMQQNVCQEDGQSIAITIRALEFLLETEPMSQGDADESDDELNMGLNLALLVMRMAAALKKNDPDNPLAATALNYLKRIGSMSPMRDAGHG